MAFYPYMSIFTATICSFLILVHLVACLLFFIVRLLAQYSWHRFGTSSMIAICNKILRLFSSSSSSLQPLSLSFIHIYFSLLLSFCLPFYRFTTFCCMINVQFFMCIPNLMASFTTYAQNENNLQNESIGGMYGWWR